MMYRAHRIMMLLILMGSLVAACDANAPTSTDEPALIATEASPEPEVVLTEPIPTAEPTLPVEPTPLGKAALLASLLDHPVIQADNLQAPQFLGQFTLAEEPMTFETWAWSQDGRRLAMCYPGEISRVVIYDLEDGGQETTIEIQADVCHDPFIGSSESPTFSRDGELLAAPAEDGFGIYQTATGELVSVLEHEYFGSLDQVVFSSQGTRLAVSFDYKVTLDGRAPGHYPFNSIHLFEVETGNYFGTFFKRNNWYITDLEYSTEGEYLVAASYNFVEAWHVDGGQLPLVFCRDAEITFSPVREEAALSCHLYGEPIWEQMIWDLATGDLTPLSDAPDTQILDLKYSPDGSLLAGLSETGLVSIWDAATGQLLLTLTMAEQFESPMDLAFVYGGRALAVLNEFGFIGLYAVQ